MPETSQTPILTTAPLPARAWKVFLGLTLVSAGSFFCWWLFATWQKAARMDSWLPVRAMVLSSKVVPWQFNEFSQIRYQPRIRYRYESAGAPRESERIRRVAIRSAHPEQAAAWVEKFPQGALVTAWVDPANPDSAVLKRDSKAALYSIWFPALFVAGGLGMILSALRPSRF
ncbi:MAG: Protein of unknown function DUF3592 [Verrucomicrobia bacterium]|jgi:hypothetical protein|nr:MAG: Protein of unknown function DUF3592 [Verrucomicrobiota bacterium]